MRSIFIVLLILPFTVFSQEDFSKQWKDFFSYTDVKDFTIVDNELIAITENSMFITDLDDFSSQKFSSINGLSGLVTSSVGFDQETQKIVIGYEKGLVEIITENNDVIPMPGIVLNPILVSKEVKGFYFSEIYKYVFGDFGVIELNTDDYEFGDRYELTNSGLPSITNDLLVSSNVLYAATEKGVFSIDLNSDRDPSIFSNWTSVINNSIESLIELNQEVFFVRGSSVYSVNDINNPIITALGEIIDVTYSDNDLVLTTLDNVEVYDAISFSKREEVSYDLATSHVFQSKKSIIKENNIYMSTDSYGVLSTSLDSEREVYNEIHPDGPSSNSVFSLTAEDNVLLLTYGGFNLSYNRNTKRAGLDIYSNGNWNRYSNSQTGGGLDYTKSLFDPLNPNRILISTYDKGVVELEYDSDNKELEFKTLWNDDNTEGVIPHLIAGFDFLNWEANMIVDQNNHIWTANARANENRIFSKFDSNQNGGSWVDYADFDEFKGNGGVTRGINKMYVDENNYIFTGASRIGLLVFDANDESTNRKTGVVDSYDGSGGLSSDEVFSVVSDENNKVWIGMDSGLMVFDDYENLFNETKQSARTVIIEENGEAREFLADIQINDILIDNAGNKWFGTNGSGLFYTSSDAQTTFETFKTGNSPLPSDIIFDLELDESTGVVYIVTEKGVVSYDPQNEPFGISVTEVVAYPNPAIRNISGHEEVTIVAKNGEGIPEGTNVKIMDVSGRLVYETNVGADSGAVGGKVVWDKKNLSGNYVVSGVYIVLLSSQDTTETTTTKIAIVN